MVFQESLFPPSEKPFMTGHAMPDIPAPVVVEAAAGETQEHQAAIAQPTGEAAIAGAIPALPAKYLALRSQLPKTVEDPADRERREMARGLDYIGRPTPKNR